MRRRNKTKPSAFKEKFEAYLKEGLGPNESIGLSRYFELAERALKETRKNLSKKERSEKRKIIKEAKGEQEMFSRWAARSSADSQNPAQRGANDGQ